MRQIFKIFLNAEGTRPWLVLTCLLLGGLAEAIGIGTLLPVASTLMGGSSGTPSVFEKTIHSVMQAVGIEVTFTSLIMLLLSIMLLRSLLLFFAMVYAATTATRVSIGLRRKLMSAILDARWTYYANQNVGQLATFMGNDATRSGEAYLAFATAAACSIQIFAYAFIALLVNWKVALAGIAGGLLVALASAKLVKIARRAGFKMTDRIGTLTSLLVDMLSNIKALKSMHRYGPMLAHVDNTITRLKRAMYAQSFARFGLNYGNDFLVALLVAAGAYAAHVWAGSSITEMFVFGILFFQVVSYASKLQKQIQAAALFHGAYDRLTAGIQNAEGQREVAGGSLTPKLQTAIVFDHVSFSHGETLVIDNLSLEIPVNTITVLQGPSGAGKTTILDLLVGFHQPSSGTIRVDNTSLATLDLVGWRKMIGYVPQELALLHDTVTANITLYDETLSKADIDEAMQQSGVSAFLDRLPNAADTDVGEFGGKLSGGQRQRISLARALVEKPQILILDEVTSALDPEAEAAIVNNIAALRGRYTIIAITHRPAWTHIADRLYTLRNGKAVLQAKGKKH